MYRVLLSIADKTGRNCNNLIVTNTGFIIELIISDTGISISYLNDTMQYKLAIGSTIKRNIILP